MTKTNIKNKVVSTDDIKKVGLEVADFLATLELIRVAIDNNETVVATGDNKVILTIHQQSQLLCAIQDQVSALYRKVDKVAYQLLNCEEELSLKNE